MNQTRTIHRSENLTITFAGDTKTFEVELRFPTSLTRGSCDARCPRCQTPGVPSNWEISGPDDSGNLIWLTCPNEDCPGNADPGYRWTQNILFPDGWIDTDNR